MKKISLHVRLFAVTGAVLAAGAVVLAAHAGSWLLVSDPLPPRLDVIFTFGGENARVAYSHELTARYPEARWVLSDHGRLYSRILARNGVDISAISVVDTCTNTLSELHGLADWLRVNLAVVPAGTGSADSAALSGKRIDIGLVSAPYHLRRIRCMAREVLRGRGLVIHCLPVPLERFGWTKRNFDRWWSSKPVRAVVWSEIGKLLFYLLLE